MNYRSFIASTIKNGGMIKTSRQGLVPLSSSKSIHSINNSLKHMKLGSGTPAHKKINELEFLTTTQQKKTHGGSGSGLKSKKHFKPLTLKF
jgi:hypothetical protein